MPTTFLPTRRWRRTRPSGASSVVLAVILAITIGGRLLVVVTASVIWLGVAIPHLVVLRLPNWLVSITATTATIPSAVLAVLPARLGVTRRRRIASASSTARLRYAVTIRH